MNLKRIHLRNAHIYDGLGGPPYAGDICIEADRIVSVGEYPAGFSPDDVIDLNGFAACPGFIDTHGHSEFSIFRFPLMEGKTLQGITTEINGNCGLSGGPLLGAAIAQREPDLLGYGITERWTTLGEFLRIIEGNGMAINYATLAGHGNIRASTFGYENIAPSTESLAQMKTLLRDCIEAGAIGYSTGLIYPPGVFSNTDELIELALYGREAMGDAFIYATHMRSEGDRLLEAIDETLRIGRESGVRVHISHIKTSGKDNWDKIDRALELIESAKGDGVRVTADRYPYNAGSTDLDSVLPDWVFEGGNLEALRRLRDAPTARKIKDELTQVRRDWDSVVVAGVSRQPNKWMEGKRLVAIAEAMNQPVSDALIAILIDEELRIGAIFHSMLDDNLRRFFSMPYVMVGTDSSARAMNAGGKPHPRGFGSFPRYLNKYAASLADGIHKITRLPAETFGIKRRGVLRPGYFADIVVFDPLTLEDTATYDDPLRGPIGIKRVYVNGVSVVIDGAPTGQRAGRVLRHGI